MRFRCLSTGDADQFLAGQLQPAVLAEAARQKDWPLTLRIQAGYDHSYYFMASFMKIISASMRNICSGKFSLLPGSLLHTGPFPHLHSSIRLNPGWFPLLSSNANDFNYHLCLQLFILLYNSVLFSILKSS